MTTRRAGAMVMAVLLSGVVIGAAVQGGTAAVVHGAVPPGYTVVNTRIIGPTGRQFIPYGFVVECMSFSLPVNQLCTGHDPHTNQTGWATVLSAGTTWNANVIRFQVAQENLFGGPRGAVDPAYVALMDGLVNEANGLGMVAIMTLQERNQTGQAGPTSSSTTFWQWMAGHYAANPKVMFDLFNEPYGLGTFRTQLQTWDTWQKGNTAYVGMQSLVDTIRSAGAANVVVAEGPDHDQDLSLVMSHLLSGGNIAYGFEPNLDSNGIADGSGDDRTQADQFIRFGQFAGRLALMPEAFVDYYGSAHCDPQSPHDVRPLFDYLNSLQLGLISFSLDPGEDARNNALDTPTSTSGWGVAPWSAALCPAHPTVHQPLTNFGPGVFVLVDFAQSVKQ